jgi:hypothetical protein
VRKRVSILCLAFAWLCANGVVLDLAQAVAWGRMFAGYAVSMPMSEALQATFDPARPCPICTKVSTARTAGQPETPAPVAPGSVKLDLACEIPATLFGALASTAWPDARIDPPREWISGVPVPPPRV